MSTEVITKKVKSVVVVTLVFFPLCSAGCNAGGSGSAPQPTPAPAPTPQAATNCVGSTCPWEVSTGLIIVEANFGLSNGSLVTSGRQYWFSGTPGVKTYVTPANQTQILNLTGTYSGDSSLRRPEQDCSRRESSTAAYLGSRTSESSFLDLAG
jgi:hypothetical protein